MDIQLGPLMPDLVGSDAAHVVLALNKVSFMDASGIGVLMRSRRKAVLAGGEVRLAAPSTKVRKLLRITGTDRVFRTFQSLDEAMAAPMIAGLFERPGTPAFAL
jgi:anti-sigma B factor antagonist